MVVRKNGISAAVVSGRTCLNVREHTMFWMPGVDFAPFPIRPITSKVLRPIRNVSNCVNMPAKSMSGSMTIQTYSPLGPAMYPSRLIAPPYRTSRMGEN